MTSYSIVIDGIPAPKGSKRVGRSGQMFDQAGPRLKEWQDTIAWETMRARHGKTIHGPVAIVMRFRLNRDADVDKLARGCLDGLEMGGAFDDDKQVVDLHAIKDYFPTRKWRNPRIVSGCDITVTEVTDGELRV